MKTLSPGDVLRIMTKLEEDFSLVDDFSYKKIWDETLGVMSNLSLAEACGYGKDDNS